MSLAQQKANPRPPSSSGRKPKVVTKSMLHENSGGSDDYSEDNYDNDFDEAADVEADLKLERLRKAMQRENTKAVKVVKKMAMVV